VLSPSSVAVRHAFGSFVRDRQPSVQSTCILGNRAVLVRPDRVSQSDTARSGRARSTGSRVSERRRAIGPCSFERIACVRATPCDRACSFERIACPRATPRDRACSFDRIACLRATPRDRARARSTGSRVSGRHCRSPAIESCLAPGPRSQAQRSARRNWWEDRPIVSSRLRTSPESLRSTPGSSFGGLAAIEPGSRDRPEDRSPVRSGGSHLPLRAGRNVPAGLVGPQPPYPRTSPEMCRAYPRVSGRCGWHVDDPSCNIRVTRPRRRFR
jgi:hypothetical protein